MQRPNTEQFDPPAVPPPRRRRRHAPFFVAVLLAAGTTTYILNRSTELPARLAVVEPGVLYRSAQPTVDQLRRIVERYHVHTLVIAREDSSSAVAAEMKFAASAGLNVVHLPIPSRAEIAPELLARFEDAVSDPANRPVLVHCSAGRHRTGLLCALYRVRHQHWPADQAREEMLSFGFDREDHRALLKQFDRLSSSFQSSAADPARPVH